MLETMPREIGLKRKIVNNKEVYFNYINAVNGLMSVYTSVYHFSNIVNGKPDYGSAVIDKIFIDIDGFEEFNNLKFLHQELCNKNVIHTIFMSGGGFHLYIFTKIFNASPQVKSQALKCWIRNNVMGKVKIDPVPVGNLACIVRVPNTFNVKRKRFCIPLTQKDLDEGLASILEKAKKQSFEYEFFGDRPVNLNDEEISLSSCNSFADWSVTLDISKINNNSLSIDFFPPFLRDIVNKHKAEWHRAEAWKERTLMIVYLKERGLSLKEVVEFLKTCLGKDEFEHSVFREKQPYYIFNKDRFGSPYFFPTIKRLVEDGFKVREGDVSFFKTNPLYYSEAVE